MSYILDALKKSQQQREQQQSPSIPMPASSPSLSKAYYLWGVVLMLSIIALFKVFSVSEEPVSTASKQIIPASKLSLPTIQVHQAPAIQPIINPKQATNAHHTPPIQAKPKAVVAKEYKVPKNSTNNTTSNLKDLPTWDELPASIRSRIPTIHIEAHIYDPKPSKRMVIINGSLTHQGQVTSQNLKLLEITPTGIITCYQSNCFQFNIF